MSTKHRLRGFLAGCVRDRSGSVLIYTAFAAPVLLGVAGLSIDVSTWYAHARLVQSAADSAAIAGALEVMRSGDPQGIIDAAELDATTNGYDSVSDTIWVYNPPMNGPSVGAGDTVEVILERATPSFFAHAVLGGSATVSARAVARVDINDTCVWSLNPTAQSALKIAGGATVEFGCGVLVNSDDPNALTQSGSSCLTASKIKVVGGYTGDCLNSGLGEPLTGVTAVADPMASLQPPTYSVGCDYTANITVNGSETVTLDPGVYCGSINVVADGVVHFNPGLYVMDGAGLSFAGQSTVTGTDVNFYLTPNSGPADKITIGAGADVQLTAAATGELAGILFYHDGNSPSNVTHSLTGGATMDLEGIIYLPNQDLKFAGGSTADPSAAMLIANTVDFTGSTELGDFDGSAVQANNMLISATLVE